MAPLMRAAVIAASVHWVSAQVWQFARCHELQTQAFLTAGTVATSSCSSPSELQLQWASYSGTLNSGNVKDMQSLEQVSRSYQEMSQAIETASGSTPVDPAGMLSSMIALTEKMMVQATFVILNVNRSSYQSDLGSSFTRWSAIYDQILSGNLLQGIPELTNMCTLRYMLVLQQEWRPFSDSMRNVIDATNEVSLQMLPKTVDMQETFANASASLAASYSCPHELSPEMWFSALKKLNYMRINIHRAAFHLFELEMLHRISSTTTASLEDKVRHELSDASQAMQQCIRGSDNLPVPPSQGIIDALVAVRAILDSLTATIDTAVRYQSHSPDVFAAVETMTVEIDKGIDAVSLDYLSLAAALGNAPSLPPVYFADRQSVYLVELVREALWLFLSSSETRDVSKFSNFVSVFETIHTLLLEGGQEASSSLTIPRCTDACVLTQMAYVLRDFRSFRETMVQLFSYEDFQKLQMGYVRSEAVSPTLVQAMKEFKAAWISFRTTDTLRSRDLLVAYHFSNPNAAGSKDNLDSASGPERYHEVHRKYHPEYRTILYQRNYYDMFFFDLQGNCIYSVYKELDFATNFASSGTGPYRSSGLGVAYELALKKPDEIHATSWAPYAPSNGALASFLCTGVRDASELIGVFCTQMPAETRPITVTEMETALETALTSMSLAGRYKEQGGGCPPSTLQPITWEQLLARMSLVDVHSYRIQTEFQLISSGYSQLWLDQAATGREDQKASVAASITTELSEAMAEFKAAWDAYRPTNEERLLSLQIAYILLNPNPTGEKDKLDYAQGPEQYHEVHRKYHPTYRALLYAQNYYDIFFLDMEGNCIYSVYKELDYATNFAADGSGEWKDSGLGDAFRAAKENPDQVNYVDWKPYGPSHGALASFLSIAVRRGGNVIGVFCTQLPPEFEPRNSTTYLQDSIRDLSDTFRKFRYGSLEEYIHPPPTQPIADGLIAANDIWDQLRPLLYQEQELSRVSQLSNQLANSAATLNQVLLDAAWEAQPVLQGANLQLSSQQLLIHQRLTRDAVRYAVAGQGSAFQQDITTFEQNLQALIAGRTRRLSAKNDIAMVTSIEGLRLLSAAEAAWQTEKPKLLQLFDLTSVSEAQLKEFMDVADDTRAAAENVMQYISTTTRTTTLIEVHVLTPVPLTGKWAAGQTFRTALSLAEHLINEDQLILPGYKLVHDVLDDECDGGKGADVVVSAKTQMDSYVALGGMGCNDVCRQVSTLSSSLKLPFLSFDCPSPDFSLAAVHPNLGRLGTVLEPHLPEIMTKLKAKHGWSRIFVVSGETSIYAAEVERYVGILRGAGFAAETLSPISERRQQDLENVMGSIKEKSRGEDRVLLVVGDETFFRRLVCASLTARLQRGVTWISLGAQRAEWWKKSDLSTSAQRQWLSETAGSLELVRAFKELKQGWDDFRETLQATMSVLRELYVTEEKDALLSVNGNESYHQAHRKWHPIYRSLLYRRNYYDIFLFDLQGSMIYSVYKETDYATNFAANSTGPWKDSGLGRVYQEAMANPDSISYADFSPYGPSGGADAAFFAMGVRDTTGQLLGVYAIQLPPDYEKSIEDEVPLCSLEAISEAYEGAINVVGLGRPVDSDMEKPLPCFKGHSPRSFRTLLDNHLQKGFPEGDLSTVVNDPYHEVKAHAVDAACAFAFSLQAMLKQGYTMQQVQHPDDEVYQRFNNFLRNDMDFQGVSGRVTLDGNDRANPLLLQQVQQGRNVDVALMDMEGSLQWLGNGTLEAAWQIEPIPPFEQLWILQVGLVALAVLCPTVMGLIVGWRLVRSRRALLNTNGPNQV